MATYAIGDIQGCYDSLCRLLEKINFDESTDQLWLAGDLVNRGPKSLETLQFVKALGNKAVTVLGNHDIHLLALYYGVRERREKDNTLFQVLDAADADGLIGWLQSRPIVHIEDHTIMVHAGVHPHWNMQTLTAIGAELEAAIAEIHSAESLSKLYGPSEGSWLEAEDSASRLRYALNCLTRMRYCAAGAIPDYQCSETPGNQPPHLTPWFEVPNSSLHDYTIVTGHWAALGYHQHNNVYALDSGCVWGNALTALRLDDKRVYSVDC